MPEDIIAKMLKVELHLHLDGSILPTTAFALAQENGIELPAKTLAECDHQMRFLDDCQNLADCLRVFDIPTLVLQSAPALERVAYELVKQLADDGVIYAEIRFAPQLQTAQGMSQAEAVEAVIRGCKRGEKDFPTVKTGVILCAMVFGDPAINHAANLETFELAPAYLGKGVVAVDLAGGETPGSVAGFRDLFERATALGLPYTVHAGEGGGAENVIEAVRWGAKRIGHGVHAIESDEAMRLLRDNGVTLEVCPTSNMQSRAMPIYEKHSIRPMFDYGIKTTVSTDNRTCSTITLGEEYRRLQEKLAFTDDELRQMNRYAAEASFADAATKAALLARLNEG